MASPSLMGCLMPEFGGPRGRSVAAVTDSYIDRQPRPDRTRNCHFTRLAPGASGWVGGGGAGDAAASGPAPDRTHRGGPGGVRHDHGVRSHSATRYVAPVTEPPGGEPVIPAGRNGGPGAARRGG